MLRAEEVMAFVVDQVVVAVCVCGFGRHFDEVLASSVGGLGKRLMFLCWRVKLVWIQWRLRLFV